MRQRLLLSILLSFCFLVVSMASSNSDSLEIDHVLILIGDAGEPLTAGPDPVLKSLKKDLSKYGKKSTVLFLGDNIYPRGLPDEKLYPKERKEAEAKLNAQLDAVIDHKGDVYIIPGNHDWNHSKAGGLKQVNRQEKYVEEYLNRGNVFLPNDGCPGPIVKKLSKEVVLVLADSQWFLHPMDKENLGDQDCSSKNKFKFSEKLKDIINEYDDKHLILAMHHPIFTYGEHNGQYTIKDHLFPLSNLVKGLYIPLPGLGSLYPFYRSAFGDRQDLPHPLNMDYQELILDALFRRSGIIHVSGHEHNLQHLEHKGNHFIVSGSGSKSTPVRKGGKTVFKDKKKGYAKILFMKNGSAVLEFYTPQYGKIYSTELKAKKPEVPDKIISHQLEIDSFEMPGSTQYGSSGLHQMFFGKHYRKEWSQPIKVRALNLSTEYGGLTPIKKGGGFATLSLRLEAENGNQYVLRTIDKNVTKVVPEQFRNTIAQNVMQDQIAASHPYGATAVPELAHAAGVYHTSPEVVYLPNQPMLGEYNNDFANKLFLFEERPKGNLKENDHFGNSKEIVGYDDVINEIQDNSDAKVNQEQVLRSRLFDIFLGDWDRHDDQWRWARFNEPDPFEKDQKIKVFEPIPRDRDQAFYIYKGFIPWIARQTPTLKKFQSFDHDIKNVVALNFNGQHFDRSFLTKMNYDDWMNMANDLQLKLTDESIEEAVADLPKEVYNISGQEITSKLKSRRDKLQTFAKDYYQFLAKHVDVVGTNKRELFEVSRNNDNTTDVSVFKITKDGEKEDLLYERKFDPKVTKEIRLYGLKGDDQFQLTGSQSSGSTIRIIGGKGNDRVQDQSNVKGAKKKTIYYDSVKGNELTSNGETKDLRNDVPADNSYNRFEFYYNTSLWIPFLSFNGDDGLILKSILTQTKYGFRKKPYAFKHNLSIGVTTSTLEFAGSYSMEMLDVFGKTDFTLDAELFVPNDVNNYFGLGNEIEINDQFEIDYYRYKQYSASFKPAIQYKSKRGFHNLKIGPFYSFKKLRSTQDRFVNQFEFSGFTDSDFDANHLTGLSFIYEMNKVDNPLYPKLGMRFRLDPRYTVNLSDGGDSFFKFGGALTLYNYIKLPNPLVWATKIEGYVNTGDYEFYQANYVGQHNGLRAFRNNRFGGKAAFVLSNDIRIPLFGSNNYVLPFKFGIVGSFDYGRAWNNDDSTKWHDSYGGGIFFSPYLSGIFSVTYMTSSEDSDLININFGFGF